MNDQLECETLNLYEEDLNDETVKDYSSQNLQIAPSIQDYFICVVYLQNNNIKILPEEFFPPLPNLKWLDLRDNELTDLPITIKEHPSLTHLLLKNNKLTSLPNELGTVPKLEVLQVSGNPLMYPPKEIIRGGIKVIKQFLFSKCENNALCNSDLLCETNSSTDKLNISDGGNSYNSVLEEIKEKEYLTVCFNEKETEDWQPEKIFTKNRERCPKFSMSSIGKQLYSQSSKYLKPTFVDGKKQIDKLRQNFLKEMAQKRHSELLATRDKIIQSRKNLELLNNWRKHYRNNKMIKSKNTYVLEPSSIPYDVSPEYMTLLSRDDIEKDLPDKYRKKLIRKCRPSVPRKNTGDVHLALKIKELFENLEAINLNRKDMTPRTEQKMLLNEIQKISEIKHKLNELSTTNIKSVIS